MTDTEKKPRIFHIMLAGINQHFNDQIQSVKMSIEVIQGNANFDNKTEKAIEFSAYEKAQEKIKHLEATVEKLREAILRISVRVENGYNHPSHFTAIDHICRDALKEDEEQTK